jgi:hypothetical protein
MGMAVRQICMNTSEMRRCRVSATGYGFPRKSFNGNSGAVVRSSTTHSGTSSKDSNDRYRIGPIRRAVKQKPSTVRNKRVEEAVVEINAVREGLDTDAFVRAVCTT